jgi:hypothetical protein
MSAYADAPFRLRKGDAAIAVQALDGFSDIFANISVFND